MLLCFCAIGVKAADTNGSVKFNPGVRYSQWAINSRLHDFYGNQKKFGFDYYDNNGTLTKGVTWYKLDGKTEVTRSFDYVAGLVGKASLEAADSMKISTGQSLGSMLHKVMLLAHFMQIRI